jgi:hypothetical protein
MIIFSDRVAILISRRTERRGKGHTEREECVGFTGSGVGASKKIFDGEGSDRGSKAL